MSLLPKGVTASELASAEGVRHRSMTATVASLIALGLVERRPDPDDGRRLLIGLTAEGRTGGGGAAGPAGMACR
ncbi:MarR family transcriptional regulator [Sphaerisporangium sp. NPDC088356]|uniref:MarR family winged helix-turn-helix transcriptional regulator n=1 Tax=Sphaerisporangium sp. NPDC088356 TaxID=3154871 RepID=UPI00343E7579